VRSTRRIASARLFALAALAVLTAGPHSLVVAQEATPAAAATPVVPLPPGAIVVATGLLNPRGIALTEDGSVYVAEAGLGGDEPFESPMFGPSTRGTTGQVSRIAPDGTKSTVAAGLPSFSLGGFEVVGPADIVVADGALYVTTSHYVPGVEPRPNDAAVLQIDLANGGVSTVGDLGASERGTNPDGFVLESDPYGIALGADGALYAADAGANALYRVDPGTGSAALVAVLPGLPGAQPNPGRNGANELDPVPTGVAPAPDGGVYVGLLSGFPFPVGAAKVVRVAADGTISDAVTGLTGVIDVEVGPDGRLYVAEYGSGFDAEAQPPGWVPNSGQISRVLPDGTTQVVVDGLHEPNGIAFDGTGTLYVTVNSDAPPQAGAQGALLRIDAVAAAESGGAAENAGPPPFAAVPESARGTEIPPQGYVVDEIADDLYLVADGLYQMMFLVTETGVIAVDAPPTLADKILPAIAGVTDKLVTHVVYSHTHADHVAAMQIYPDDAHYIAQDETARLIRRANNPPLPAPTITFADRYTLDVGGQVLELAYHGDNHQPGETFIYAPRQKVLMHVDIVFPGWAPFKNLAVATDVPGFVEAFDETLAYDFDLLVSGHFTRPGTREDVELQRQYVLDLRTAADEANRTVDYLESARGVDPANTWAQFDAYADAVTRRCMELMPKRYLTLLGGADVFLEDNCFVMSESLRIDMVGANTLVGSAPDPGQGSGTPVGTPETTDRAG